MDRESPKTSNITLSEIPYFLAAVAIGLLVVAIPYLIDPRFFYLDDKQLQFIPYMTDIAAHLLQGELPFLSISTVFGGNYSIDWQHGVLNPVSLLSSLFAYSTDNLQLAGAFVAATYFPLLSLAVFLLARNFGIAQGPALLFTTIIASNNFLLYWAGSSWHNHLVGVTWFAWAWFFLLHCGKRYKLAPIGLAISTYLLLTSGFPHAALAACTIMAVGIVKAFQKRNNRELLDVLVGGGSALLFALPSLLPAFFSLLYTDRGTGISNGTFLTPGIGDYLMAGAPAYLPKLLFWEEYDFDVPIFYLTWFFPFLLLFIDFKKATQVIKRLTPIFAILIILLVLGTGPESLGPVRWPFRYIPFVHIAAGIILFSLLFHSGPLIITKKRILLAQGLVFLVAIIATFESPRYIGSFLSAFITAILLSISVTQYRQRGINSFIGVLTLGILIFFGLTHAWLPINPDVPDYGAPTIRNNGIPVAMQDFKGYTLSLGPLIVSPQIKEGSELPLAASYISKGRYAFNGYSALGHKSLQKELCINRRTQTECPEGAIKWTELDEQTKLPLLDLFRITRVTAQYGMWWDEISSRLGPTWHSAGKGNEIETFERNTPITLPGTLSWHPQGMQVAETEPMKHQHESISIEKNAEGGQLIFARLFWPGYRATFNGKPLKVIAHRGFLVAVDLPPETTGRLDLWFRPPGLRLGLGFAGLGLAILMLYLLLARQFFTYKPQALRNIN